MAELYETAVVGEGATLLPPRTTSQLRNTSVTQQNARQTGSSKARYELYPDWLELVVIVVQYQNLVCSTADVNLLSPRVGTAEHFW